jgi:hypothetical protein
MPYAGLNYCRDAGWGSFEKMAAGFERDIERRAFGAWSGLVECENFCVRLPWTLVISAADDAAVLHDECADHGIRTGLALALRRKTKRQGHEVKMRCGDSHRILRVTRARLRGRSAAFAFVVLTVDFFPFAPDRDTLRAEWLDPASANAAWAAASRAMGMR